MTLTNREENAIDLLYEGEREIIDSVTYLMNDIPLHHIIKNYLNPFRIVDNKFNTEVRVTNPTNATIGIKHPSNYPIDIELETSFWEKHMRDLSFQIIFEKFLEDTNKYTKEHYKKLSDMIGFDLKEFVFFEDMNFYLIRRRRRERFNRHVKDVSKEIREWGERYFSKKYGDDYLDTLEERGFAIE